MVNPKCLLSIAAIDKARGPGRRGSDLPTAALTERCLKDVQPNEEACRSAVEKSLATATALNPYIGYERAAALAKEAFATGKTIRELCREKKILPDDQLDEALDPWRMTQPEK